jgi:hypothetical protein
VFLLFNRVQVAETLPVYEEDLFRTVHLQPVSDSAQHFTLNGIKLNVCDRFSTSVSSTRALLLG